MNGIRRNYLYLTAFISLQIVSWSAIALLRNLFDPPLDRFDVAWQAAVLIIGVPVFAGHWLWAQRLTAADREERQTFQRRLYQFGVMTAALWPSLTLLFWLLEGGLDYALEGALWPRSAIQDGVSGMLILIPVGVWHYRLWQTDKQLAGETANTHLIRRLFQWGFTTAGLIMVVIAGYEFIDRLFAWALNESGYGRSLVSEISGLIIGTGLLAVFWWWNQTLFKHNTGDEQHSLLRKLYLYLTLFITLVTAVTNLAILIASLLQVALGLDTSGQLSDVLALIVTAGGTWAIHLWVLKKDAQGSPDVQQQIGIRQMYQYLSAGVGLLAFLVGVGGLMSVLIRALAGQRYDQYEISWYIAAVVAGLPLWGWFWRKTERAAAAHDSAEHDSLVRRSYLYIFVLLATLTVLAAGVYLVYRLLSLMMGLTMGSTAAVDLGHAFAYGGLGVAIWLYHERLIRADGRRQELERASRLSAITVAVLDNADGQLGQTILNALQRMLPALHLTPVGMTAQAAAVLGHQDADAKSVQERVRTADIVVGPWTMRVDSDPIAQAVAESGAHKLLIPVPEQGWTWAGVNEWEPEQVAKETAELVEQLAIGREGGSQRRRGIGGMIGVTAVGGLILLVTMGIVLSFILEVMF